jgi:hypothetical protein
MATLFNIEHYRTRKKVVQHNLKRGVLIMMKATGTDGSYKKRGPAVDESASPSETSHGIGANHNSARVVPKITFAKPTRRLIAEGWYQATCCGTKVCWMNFGKHGRWDAEILFSIDEGLPLSRHSTLGNNPQNPTVNGNGWLGKLFGSDFEGCGSWTLEMLQGVKFYVKVGTVTTDRNQEELSPDEQYSVIRRVVRRARGASKVSTA